MVKRNNYKFTLDSIEVLSDRTIRIYSNDFYYFVKIEHRYTMEVGDKNYHDVEYISYKVAKKNNDHKILPSIVLKENLEENKIESINIETISYGDLNEGGIKLLIDNYNIALKSVEYLKKIIRK